MGMTGHTTVAGLRTWRVVPGDGDLHVRLLGATEPGFDLETLAST